MSDDRIFVSHAPDNAGAPRKIFVAMPASDMRDAYLRLVREFQHRGFEVYPPPDGTIPDNAAEAFIDEALSGVEAAIHLLGEKPGYTLERSEPIVRLQLSRARAKAAGDTTAGFRRIVWAPEVLDENSNLSQPEVMRDPLMVLHKFDRQIASDMVVGDSFADLLGFLKQYLWQRSTPAFTIKEVPKPAGEAQPAPEPRSGTNVYIYNKSSDSKFASNVAGLLRWFGVNVLAVGGDEADAEKHHREALITCDSVVLCWAEASDVWMLMSARELADWRALGRNRPFDLRALVARPPPGAFKSLNLVPSTREIDIIIDLTDGDRSMPEEMEELAKMLVD